MLASLTFDVKSAGILYFNSHNQITESTPPHEPSVMKIESQESEWLHSIENIDNHTYEVCVCEFFCLSSSKTLMNR